MGDRKYGICLQPCTIQLIPVIMNNTGCLSAGSLFQILQRNNLSDVHIKRLDYTNKRQINYEKETYICHSTYFKEIDHQLFLLLLAVKPEKRLNLIHDEQLLIFARRLHINQRVLIPKTSFHGRQNDLDCVVRYIGAVPEIGLGIFFGFILVDPLETIPKFGTLGQKYLRCDNSKGFIRAVDVFYKRFQPNQLRSYPSISSIDPYGSMESLLSERSFKSNNRRTKRNNDGPNHKNRGMPIYNIDKSSGSGMNSIKFEPVHPNLIQPCRNIEKPKPLMDQIITLDSITNRNPGRVASNVSLPNKMSVPFEYRLPNFEQELEFTPVPNNMYSIPKSNLRQKYELLKKELDTLKNARAKRSNDAVASNESQIIAGVKQIHVQPKGKYNCSLKSCTINKPKHLQQRQNDYNWNGQTEYYTNTVHQTKCFQCHELKLKCYTSKLYGPSREFNTFIAVLNESGFKVSLPENKYLAVTAQDKTKMVDFDKKREAYYGCTIRANITIHKNRFKSQCRKCDTSVDTSQGISLMSCHHIFCSSCIKSYIQSSETPVMKCPDPRCLDKLVEDEIHAFMSETEFQLHMKRMEATAKFKPDDKVFYCKSKSCNGCIEVNRTNREKIVLLYCPECGQFNCMDCNTIHNGLTCDEYQRRNPTQKQKAIEDVNLNTGARNKNIFKCKVEKCRGYLQVPPNENINMIACPECSTINCRSCDVIHTNLTCREYQRSRAETGRKTANFSDDEWVCSNCTYQHKEKLNRCEMCYTKREVPEIVYNFEIDSDDEYLDEFNSSEDTDEIESITSTDANQYEKLLELEDMDIIRNTNKFECITCFDQIDVGKGVKLRDCLHEFCEECLTGVIKASDQAPVTCPFRDNEFVCEGTIQHREMRYLVNEDVYEQYLYRSLLQAQKDLKNCFQCRTPDCRGMWEFDDNINAYKCPLCQQVNCHQCNAIHGTMSCRAYQETVYDETNPAALATRQMYDEMFANGTALRCPQCKIVIAREEGCSWVLCIICKTEICWVTRGPRWGPKGKGDISGGCRCDYKNGKPCHPDCAYCH